MIGAGRGPRISPPVAGAVAGLVIALIVLVMGWINVRLSAPWESTHRLTAQVSDVDGISVSSDVRIAGRLVGQVTGVSARGDHADVVFSVDSADWPLPADTTADIRLANLLGEKYLELVPGSDPTHRLADNGDIPQSATRPVVDFDQWLSNFDTPTRDALTSLVRTLGDGVQGQEGNLQLLVPALRDLSVHSQAPTATLAQHDADLDSILTNLGTVADQLNRSRDDLAGVIDNLNSVTGALAANPDALRGFIRNTDALNRTAHQVLGSGGAGQLAAGLQQLDPVAGQLDRLLTALVPQSQGFKDKANSSALTLVHEIGDATSQSDKDGYFLRQNLLGVDCSGLLPTGTCTVPTSLPPLARPGTPPATSPSPQSPPGPLPSLPQIPLIPGLGGVLGGPEAAPATPMPPPVGLDDWWTGGAESGPSLVTLDLWGTGG